MNEPAALTRRNFVASAASAAALTLFTNQQTWGAQPPTNHGGDMTKLIPYLLFDGKCGEAMDFYKAALGGELTLTKVKDSPASAQMQPFQQEKVLNAHFKSGALELSASDWLALDETPVRGNTVCLFLTGGTFQELKTAFDGLSQGAEITNPLKELFFGVYGALNDKFGVRWMFQSNKQDA
jgi:PhnB protein